VNRSRSRSSAVTSGVAALGVAATVLLSGCGAGQISQTAMQQPAINGTNVWVGQPTYGIALRNLHLRAPQTADYVEPGTDVELIFVAINGSADQPDKLVSITSEFGTVSVTGKTEVPANGSLVVGAPDGQISALEAVDVADAAEAKVTLTKPITNGINYDFTFTFEKAGSSTIAVPISAGETQRRDKEPEIHNGDSGSAIGGEVGGGHGEGGH
jgi:copper(I)-binding protein